MRRILQLLILALLPVAASPPAWAQLPELERTVEFRDGSLLRMRLPDYDLELRQRGDDRTTITQTWRLSQLAEVRFSQHEQLLVLDQLDVLVDQLADDRYHVRERASAALLVLPPVMRPFLEQAAVQSLDPEVRSRLKRSLHLLPKVEQDAANAMCDELLPTHDPQWHPGDLGTWHLESEYRGHRVSIDRLLVRGLRWAAPDSRGDAARSQVAHLERIPIDNAQNFPIDKTTRIDFETTPDNQPLKSGTNIERTYLPLGVMLSTSKQDSFVSVNGYNVGGPSGGMSCATHSPRFQGEITIRFCVPGNSNVAAGVTRVGLWVAAVSPNGTALEAYDSRDRRLSEVKTVSQSKDFLGIQSDTPMAYVKVVPDPKIDPDYTIDDLVFDFPRPLAGQGVPGSYTVLLANGERLFADAVELASGELTAQRVTIGIHELKLPLSEAAGVFTPSDGWQAPAWDAGCWVKLIDGSVLRCQHDAGLRSRWSAKPMNAAQLAALWGAGESYREPPVELSWKTGEAVLLEDGQPKKLGRWRLGDHWLEVPQPAADVAITYANSPPVWLRKLPVRRAGSGLLRLVTGEELILHDDGLFQLESWTPQIVTVLHQGKPLEIDARQVLSLAPAQ